MHMTWREWRPIVVAAALLCGGALPGFCISITNVAPLASGATSALSPTPANAGNLSSVTNGHLDDGPWQTKLLASSGTDVFWHRLVWNSDQQIGTIIANTEYAYQRYAIQMLKPGGDPDQNADWQNLGTAGNYAHTTEVLTLSSPITTRGLRFYTDEAAGGVAARWTTFDYGSFNEIYAFKEILKDITATYTGYNQSHSDPGYEAYRMADRNTEADNCWSAGGANNPPQWAELTWATMQAVDNVLVNAYQVGDGRNPDGYDIYFRRNGVWDSTPTVSVPNDSWTGYFNLHDVTVKADGIRINVTSNRGGAGVTLSELFAFQFVPEPTAALLLLLGAATCLARRRSA